MRNAVGFKVSTVRVSSWRNFAPNKLAFSTGVPFQCSALLLWMASVSSTRMPSMWKSSNSAAALLVNIWRTFSCQKHGVNPLEPLSR